MPQPPAPTAGPSGLDRVETWIFDLDNTLYPPTEALSEQTNRLLRSFIADLLSVDEEEAFRIQKQYFREFGLTMRGLMVRHAMDPAAYVAHMAQADMTLIAPNPALADALRGLEGRLVIHTNAFDLHAERVLERLGIADLFEVVHDIAAAGYRAKPDHAAYETLCERHAIDPTRAVMIDDIAHNLAPAAALGMTTVWLRNRRPAFDAPDDPGEHVHHVIEDLVGFLTRPPEEGEG